MGNAFSNPLLLQGNLRKKPYFEGWYYKQVSTDGKSAISFIPGISINEKNPHCFIQYIFIHEESPHHSKRKTGYIRFPLEEFLWNDQPFAVKIGENFFSESFLSLHLKDDDNEIEGKLQLGTFTPIQRTPYMPNIMGPFAYIPHMECYHGVISMSHSLKGALRINGKTIDFNGGKGYLEKDWGTNFPRDYVWLQSNHFSDPGTSIFFSNAHIPFYGKEFQGYICNLIFEGKQHRFATYTRSRLEMDLVKPNQINIQLENAHLKVKLEARYEEQGSLIAPVRTGMEKVIKEGISGEIRLWIDDKKTNRKYEDIGTMAGIEIVE